MEALINYAYSGRIVLNKTNVQSIMVGASFLQLQSVRDACADFLKSHLHPNNALGISLFADRLNCSSLVEESTKYIQQYFHQVSLSDEFLVLSVTDLKELISKDDLYVMSESQVFEAVIRWIKHNVDERLIHLPKLLILVRLPLLSPEYLVDHVAKEDLIRRSHECRDLLDEAKDCHLMPERKHLLESYRFRTRVCTNIVGHIFAVGGLTKYGNSLSTVEVYDSAKGVWRKSEAMTMDRSRVGVAVHQNKLYAFGGYNGVERLATVEVYHPALKIWKIIAPMHHKRR